MMERGPGGEVSVLYPIPLEDAPGRLAITARPRGHDWLADEVVGWKRAGVSVVVSLLTPDEETELGLVEEAAECTAAGLQFLRLPVPDRGIPPNRPDFERVVSEVVAELNRGGTVAVHCRQGIGRSALVVLGVLKAMGIPTADAVARVTAARGVPVPETNEQVAWVEGV
jgi:protein-tyrosine phosphatase